MPTRDPSKVALYNRRYYERGGKTKIHEHRDQDRARNRAYVWAYLASHPCVDCRNSDPRVLEFDHRDPATKTQRIAVVIQRAVSLARLHLEIEKCDVRCANCHRIRTYAQQGYWVASLPSSMD